MEVTLKMTEIVRELECEGAVIVTDRGNIITCAHGCDGTGLLAVVVGLDIAFDELLKILKERYHLSYEEIYSTIGKIKAQLADM